MNSAFMNAQRVVADDEKLSVVDLYHRTLERRGFKSDSSQLRAVERLQQLYEEWTAYKARRSTALKRLVVHPALPRGVYLWGGVGRGKSFLMDSFYRCLPLVRKRRVHFHHFMRDVHRELEENRRSRGGIPRARRGRPRDSLPPPGGRRRVVRLQADLRQGPLAARLSRPLQTLPHGDRLRGAANGARSVGGSAPLHADDRRVLRQPRQADRLRGSGPGQAAQDRGGPRRPAASRHGVRVRPHREPPGRDAVARISRSAPAPPG